MPKGCDNLKHVSSSFSPPAFRAFCGQASIAEDAVIAGFVRDRRIGNERLFREVRREAEAGDVVGMESFGQARYRQ